MSERLKSYYSNPENRLQLSEQIKDLHKSGRLSGRAKTSQGEIERKNKISLSMVGNRNGSTAYRRRSVEFQGEIYKSSWEVSVAKYFIIHKTSFLYESKTFLLGSRRSYTPDFYLPEDNKYIEVKGYWRKENREKYDLFLNLYPNIKIEVWDKQKLSLLKIFDLP